jgi:hypothetical protein
MDKKNKAEDLLKHMVAQIDGQKEEDVILEGLSSKKRGPQKKSAVVQSSSSVTLDSGEGLQITNVETTYEDWRNIKSKRHHAPKNHIEEWGASDFFYFAKKLYQDKYQEGWNLRVGGGSVEINKIRDKLAEMSGFSSNLMMRDYIVYFFKNNIDYYKKQNGFCFKQMRSDHNIAYFIDHYDYSRSFAAHMNQEKIKNIKPCSLNREDISKSYKVGDTTLLCNYGLVITLNWLVLNKKLNKEQAFRLVSEACQILKDKGLLSAVQKATEVYSPYPIWLPVNSLQEIISQVGHNLQIHAVFNNDQSEQFNFFNDLIERERR